MTTYSPYIPGWSPAPAYNQEQWEKSFDPQYQGWDVSKIPTGNQAPSYGFSGYGAIPQISGIDMAKRDIGGAIDIGSQINKYLNDYQRSNIPNYGGNLSELSNRITDFLNPYDPVASYDVAMHGAEGAAGRGLPGGSSGLGGQLTGRLRQHDIERRAALGANLMGQEVSWLPKPFDPSKLLIDPSTVYGEQQANRRFDVQQQNQFALEQFRALQNRNYGGNGGRIGKYGYDPTAGTTRRMPMPIAPAPSQKPALNPTWPGFDGTPWPGSTVNRNPDGTWGWGYAGPWETDPETGETIPEGSGGWTAMQPGIPDPILFGPSWKPGDANPWAPEPQLPDESFDEFFW